jgi:hypothetical protein
VEFASFSSTMPPMASLPSAPTTSRLHDGDPVGEEAEQPPLADRALPSIPRRGRGPRKEGAMHIVS